MSTGLTVFATDTGYAGSRHGKLLEDDIVTILFGCALPLILRPASSRMFTLVDAVYVDGIMYGEFLADESMYTEVEFVLRYDSNSYQTWR